MNQDPPADKLTYERYLKVPKLLEQRKPLANPASHDEMLFIISHQVFELPHNTHPGGSVSEEDSFQRQARG